MWTEGCTLASPVGRGNRSRCTVGVGKVKGHATDAMVADGRVRKEDKGGHDASDT